ncbi:VPA1267 family protein [Pseudomonas atacamensis]|jgi:hypothetical protein|uniref:VPA1267 family protein n=1 Tax=Pseudomonas atacamensis TaxID=2565368 RepID=UPI001FAD19EA|nr:VPA1267 family protein [Pseudomonas atacamensis]MCI9875467.1 hypothetical protein [Pseudomonas atacamensis]
MSNGRQLADHNVSIFTAWISSKSGSDFSRMIHRGALSRSVIAQECGFAKSALAQNPRIKALLTELETNLRATGVLPQLIGANAEPGNTDPSSPKPSVQRSPSVISEAISTSSSLEAKLQRLQTENACQRAEIEELRKQLKQFTSIHEALSNSGRIPR